jgi:branched-chain amino acid transport system ATP-binding protein
MGGFFADRDQFQTRIKWVYELFPRLHERRIQAPALMTVHPAAADAAGSSERDRSPASAVRRRTWYTIEQLREQGMTIFLVEQNANQALKLADRGYVLELNDAGLR